MVTCQSANQLKIPVKVSWAFKMVSQFGSLLIWQLSRRQSLTPFTRRVSPKHALPKKLAVHRVLYPSMLTESWVEGKSVEEKDAQPTERTAALWGLSSKIDSRIWVNFTRNGLRLVSRHQEPPHTDVSRNLATVVIRGVLLGLRRRKTGVLPRGPTSSFQMRASFVFNLENKVLESGGRVEKLIASSCLKSSVKFPQSVMIWGAMSSAGVGPLCFLKTNVTAPVYQEILEHFMLPSADQLFKDADFPAGFGTCPHCQKHQKWVKWPWSWCAWLASKLTRPEPHRECSVCVHWIYLIHKFHNLSWITEINELFHDILIYRDAPVMI